MTHEAAHIIEALEFHRDASAKRYAESEGVPGSVVYAGWRDALDLAIQIVVEEFRQTPTGWDTGAEPEPSDGSFAEYDRGPSFEVLRDAGRA